MENKVYEIGNRNDLKFSVQKTTPYIIRGNAKEMMPEEITFLFEEIDPESDLTEDNNLVCSISKEEAVNLAIRLLKLSTGEYRKTGYCCTTFQDTIFPFIMPKKMVYILMNLFSRSGIWRRTILRRMEPSPYV